MRTGGWSRDRSERGLQWRSFEEIGEVALEPLCQARERRPVGVDSLVEILIGMRKTDEIRAVEKDAALDQLLLNKRLRRQHGCSRFAYSEPGITSEQRLGLYAEHHQRFKQEF